MKKSVTASALIAAIAEKLKAAAYLGDSNYKEAEQHFIVAGQLAKQAWELTHQPGKHDPAAWRLFISQSGRCRATIYRYIALADGKKTLAEIRDADAARAAKFRAGRRVVYDVTDSQKLVLAFEAFDHLVGPWRIKFIHALHERYPSDFERTPLAA